MKSAGKRDLFGRMRMVVCDMIQSQRGLVHSRDERRLGRVSNHVLWASRDGLHAACG